LDGGGEVATDPEARAQLAGWADRLQAIARTGLVFASNEYDRERYQKLVDLAAEMASHVTGWTSARIQTAWYADPGYVTPKVGAGAAIFDETGRLFLARRPDSGLWALPVGFCEVGESAAETIVREALEETRLVVCPHRLLGVYHCQPDGLMVSHHLYNVVFWCDVVGGVLTTTEEAPEADYFERERLPPLATHHAAAIADAFRARHDGWSGTAFDTYL
jgi:ADP-ribose pyrophosphatase YjhB (NUDIX family)